jgi:hypothetical protein
MSKLQYTRDIGNGVLRTVVMDCRTIYGMLLPLRFDHHLPILETIMSNLADDASRFAGDAVCLEQLCMD